MGRGDGGAWWTRETGGAPHWLIVSVLAAILVLVGGPLAVSMNRVAETYTPPARPSATPAAPTVAVFLGDSYTEGAGTASNLTLRWSSLVADELGWVEANLGVGGSGYVNSESYAARLDALVLARPNIVVISGGRNDRWHAADEVAHAASDLIAAVRERAPAAQIVMINPWWDSTEAPADMAEITEALRAVADAEQVLWLDTGQPLYAQPALLSPDGVHPNDAGYRALADAVLGAVAASDLASRD